jgi:KDO2-lipid IV(A) lauroyltransferase
MSPFARAEDFVSTRVAGLAYRGGASFVALLPERVARGLGRAVAELAWRISPRRRSRLMQNLKRLSPDLDVRALGHESRLAFGGFGESVVDTLRLSRAQGGELERRVQFDGLERLEQALDEGGAVLLGAHAGNWEWAGAALAARGLPIAAPVRGHQGRDAEGFFAEMRRRFGVRTNGRLAPLLAERGRALALFLDRAPRTGPGASVRPGRIARGAAALAARRRWTLLPALCVRENEGYRIVFGPRLRPAAGSAIERRLDARAALDFLETQLRAHRGQWFAFESLDR